ncbi:ATP synthase F0 subunit A [Candidatus Roizmanbacteria bacterium RIFCSPHIGHO2_02_FULL_37_15]|uniref:ATP synthase subunit a n=1 Tax=Candidatus Roizmanbacteria bacterium RIFCSPLOWO2_01_FULL_37_16 TaxID=1802058 RepID=A0A1F7IKL2_9BACT|nr:MAG: ATP synthase F0 subunit A [Candidatus Roizmanbacteria bacterium RIFCSPHIGHO2_01_FULL_37_16b]OGK20469.1 MAG: ATP synthase F0 subunit A [Candidatus Roizmanbacteria bacterium RIFCSPHIGHO2_02_FULL_37_15]OGK31736.1 MAG: ATP synthase F0 subunit A [Candidatus Roizmanbacteria bacterium RIFCSPHIGHO2_12_FULL_36_11]OGK43896.1 MAG: ATP synthase F0 subunit A [Candidatus Roizmanbacteria bacterium RIFCSPLOWO2_01_FULL_37_16]OGK55822.1 MAG: ATP synthase F0 subunit A [Candidatus Roizmanbacteria bacterium
MSNKPHISIKPDVLFQFLGFPVTNSYLTAIIVIAIFFLIAKYYRANIEKVKRSNFFYLLQFIFRGIYNFFRNTIGDKIVMLFPILGSLFIYILLLNWFGLLPGVGSILIRIIKANHVPAVGAIEPEYEFVPLLRANTTDLNTTLALAIIAFFSIQYFGMKELGISAYLKKFFNFSNPISFFVGFLEVVSEFSKVLSFSFRLFGNIFAGEVLLTIIAFLMPVLASFPFLLLETFVGLIQALVFSTLTAVFILNATAKSH